MNLRFRDRIAVVTGGGSGIGRAIAIRMAAEGARVVVADRAAEAAEQTAAEIGPEARALQTDTSDPAQVDRMIRFATDSFGGLHHLINNAGIVGTLAPLEKLPLDDWQAVQDTNMNGVYYGLRAGLPAIEAAGGGSVLNMASVVGCVGFANAIAYVAAKHAVVGMTRVAGLEYARRGVRVNAIGPAFTATPLIDRHFDAPTQAAIAKMHPMGRFGTVDEIAAFALFLLSDEAGFITGSYHVVDGGYSAQ